jgi:branched-chain amino acid transport system substrate-binding protein
MRNLWIVICVCAAVLLAGGYWVLQSPVTPPKTVGSSQQPASSGQRTGEDTPKDQGTVRLAVISSETGLPAGMESKIADVVSFGVERINSQGGLLGRKVELLRFDNANTALGSKKAAEEAVKAGVAAVIGSQRSSNALAMAEILQTAGIPMVAVGASNPHVTLIGDFIFRVNFTDSFQGAALARFACDNLRAKTAVLAVNVNNAYSPFLAEVFAEQFGQLGGKVVQRLDYIPQSQDFETLGADIARVGADVVFVPGYEDDSARVVAAARRAGAVSTFMGGDGWDTEMYKVGGDAVEGGYFVAVWHPEAGSPQGLAEEYSIWSEKRGESLKDVEILAMDAAFLVFSAIREAGVDNPAAIRDALSAMDGFRGVTGIYSFDRNGDPDKYLLIVRLIKGRAQHIMHMRPERVPLGVIFAKTGDAANVNIMAFEAARFAADEINLKGGVLAHRIDLLEYDNRSTALGSRRAAEEAVKAGVSAVIGASWSSHSSAMVPVIEAAGIPMVSPASTNPDVTRNHDFVFRTCYNDYMQGEVMALFALKHLNARTAAVIINANNKYSVDLAEYFVRRFEEEGKVVAKVDYLQETNDFRPLLDPIVPLSPDVVFIPGYTRDAAFIIRQARGMGMKSIFLGGDGWDDMMYEYAAKEIAGSYFSEHWHVDIPDPESRKFVEQYAPTHKLYRTGLVALTYDTVYLLADAMRRAGSTRPLEIRDALATTRGFKGITGMVTFDENGDPRKPVVVLRFDKGHAVFEQIVNPQQ